MNLTSEQEQKIDLVYTAVEEIIQNLSFLRKSLIEEISKPTPDQTPPSEKAPPKMCRILSSVHSGIYPEQRGIVIEKFVSGYVVEVDQEYVKSPGGSSEIRRTQVWFGYHEIELDKV